MAVSNHEKAGSAFISSWRNVLSWAAVVAGLVIGFFALVVFGFGWADFSDRQPGWFLRCFSLSGAGLLGASFILGSILGLVNRKVAGSVFICVMPLATFCLAYPSSGFLVWDSYGNGIFETPLPLTAVGLTLVFFTPLVVPFLSVASKKRAIYLFGVLCLGAALVFLMSRWTAVLVPRLAVWAVLFLSFGAFWLLSNRCGWTQLLQWRPRAVAGRIVVVLCTLLAILCLDVALTFAMAAETSSLFSGDCRGKQPFARPESSYHAVFTAKVVFSGVSLENRLHKWRFERKGVSVAKPDHRVGDWAIAVVHQNFWGLPSWTPRLVLLTNFLYWQGETYFVDGTRGRGLLTRMLPIVEGGIGCSRTRPENEAVIDLRVLQRDRPDSGARLIGTVRERARDVIGSDLTPPTKPSFLPGIEIEVKGPGGTRSVTTDDSGVYEIHDLAAGDYTVQPVNAAGGTLDVYHYGSDMRRTHIEPDSIVERSFEVPSR